MDTDVEVVVIGAGVVGLAVARELALRGLSVVVLERNPRPGQETSSRHSGVIHAGIYYPTGSLKARLCVEGRRRLVEFCGRYGVPHRITGKLIVAVSPAQEASLGYLRRQARANGVEEVAPISLAEVRRREPRVRCAAALWSPVTGIVDAEELIRALDRQFAAAGGHLLTDHRVTGLEPDTRGWRVEVRPGRGEAYAIRATHVVNAAGLGAVALASIAGQSVPPLHLCKGTYFWTPRPLVQGLVYPLPEAGLAGLGIHTTVDLAGRIRLGPDTEYVDRIDYEVDAGREEAFREAAARYLPDLAPGDLRPDTAGIRPKLVGPDEGVQDFRIERTEASGGAVLLSLLGIESPGLTASLAIGREVADRLGVPRGRVGPPTHP